MCVIVKPSPSVFIVLPIIRNQSKTKTILRKIPFSRHSLATILDTKLERLDGRFFDLEMLEIFSRAFLLNITIRT